MPLITMLTNRGRQILAARVPGDPPLASVKIAVGDGNGNTYVPNEAMTALVHEVWRGVATAALIDTKIAFSVTVPANIGGFTIREIGVFIGPAGGEELALVSQFNPQYKPASGENGAAQLTLVVTLDYTGSAVGAFTISSSTDLTPLGRAPHITVDAVPQTVPPAAPVDGALYAVATGGSGAFAGKGGYLALRRAGEWVFIYEPEMSVVRSTNGAWWQREGGDWVPCPFNDTSVAWVEVTGKPTEFPPSAHTHPISQVTNLQAALDSKSDVGHNHDTAYVKLNPAGGAGQTVSGDLTGTKMLAGNIAGGANAKVIVGNSGTTGTIEAVQGGDGALKQPLALQPNGGNVGVGTNAPAERLDVNGNAIVRGTLTAWANVNVGNAISVSNWVGNNGMVMRSQGAGQPSQWSNAIDLITQAEMRAKLGPLPRLQYDLITPAQYGSWYPVAVGAWVAIPLNTVMIADIAGAVAAGGSVALPAGTYIFTGRHAMFCAAGSSWQIRLRNTSTGAVIATSPIGFTNGYETQVEMSLEGRTAVAAGHSIALEIYSTNALSGSFRAEGAFGSTLISSLAITKIG